MSTGPKEKVSQTIYLQEAHHDVTKHFQKELSVTVQEYLYDSLLSEASRILLRENLSMLEVSERLGFSDQFYFARRFKAKYGVSPSKYKKIFS